MDEESLNHKDLCNTPVVTEDDSILDFKSPKLQRYRSKLNDPSSHNVKKKMMSAKFKGTAKNHKDTKLKQPLEKEKKRNLPKSQPSIESSFFKSDNNCDIKSDTDNAKEALVCPLCFKTFKELNSQAVHMKICAYKNNVSTKKLLDAIELQKRQENERKSLGLLAAPIVQERKKMASRKTNLPEESDLQLALALSKSLQEIEELDEIKELEGLPKILERSTSEPIFVEQLERFGFASSKPLSSVKSRKKRNSQVTVLQSRSQEERNRILTEKISEVLMEDEPITQRKTQITCNQEIKKEITLKSHVLNKLLYKEKKLWNKACLSSNYECFYVPELSEYITPKESQIDIESETTLKFMNTCNLEDTNLKQYKTEVSNNKEISYESRYKEVCLVNEKCDKCRDKRFVNNLVTNWQNTLNDSSASDVVIFVDNNKHVWAHKLVLYVQCSNILLDITRNDSSSFPEIKEKISWTDVSYNIALAFLEFIYCGIIEKYCSVFEESINFSSLRNLARKYKVERLFDYLEIKEIENKRVKSQINDRTDIECEIEATVHEENILELNDSSLESLVCDAEEFKQVEKYTNESKFVETELKENTYMDKSLKENICLSNINISRYSNMSPDIFDDINDTISRSKIKSIDQSMGVNESKSSKDIGTFDFINDVEINATDLIKDPNTTPSTNIEKNINSVSSSPHFNEPNEEKNFNMVQSKSDLSLFIERFRKENAKSDFDSDSEVSILPSVYKPNRNPFNIRNDDTPDQRTSASCNNTGVGEPLEGKRKHGLSIFDNYSISSTSNKRMLHDKTNDSDSESIQSIECDAENFAETNLTSNSPNKTVNNVEIEVKGDVIKRNIEDSLNLRDTTTKSSSISKYNESRGSILSNSDTDENEMSMYSKYRKNHENNSILKYRDYAKEYVLKSDIEVDPEYEKCRRTNNKDNDITSLSNTCKESEIKIDLAKENETGIKEKQLISDELFVNDKDDDYILINATSPLSSRTNIPEVQRTSNINRLRHSKSENNIDVKIRDNCNSLKSPISVSSSPELDDNISDLYKCQDKKSNSIPNFEKSLNNSDLFENDIYLANVHINNDNDDNNSMKTFGTNEEKISSVTNRESVKLITSDDFSIKKSKSYEKSFIRKQNDRKFQRKSVSETNLIINTKSVANNNSFQKAQCKCNGEILRGTKSPVIIRDNVTPPPDYDTMKTPELHAELNKYGLKIQKRKKAVKLLTYIYNELHPVIGTSGVESEFTTISSEDEEPPMKRMNCANNDECEVQISPDSDHSPITIIDEEKQFDEPELVTVADNTQNIKDVILKFITANKELHNKILAYEPLCIDSLHSALKAEGFKCKINTVMDFLDEQCITFYFKETKHRKDKKS